VSRHPYPTGVSRLLQTPGCESRCGTPRIFVFLLLATAQLAGAASVRARFDPISLVAAVAGFRYLSSTPVLCIPGAACFADEPARSPRARLAPGPARFTTDSLAASLLPPDQSSLCAYRTRSGYPLSPGNLLPIPRTMGMGPRRAMLAFAPLRTDRPKEIIPMLTGGFLLFALSAILGVAARPHRPDPLPVMLPSLLHLSAAAHSL
jgi:hypothetical protein